MINTYVPPSSTCTSTWDYYSAVYKDLTTVTGLYFTNDYDVIDSTYYLKGDKLTSSPIWDSNGLVMVSGDVSFKTK